MNDGMQSQGSSVGTDPAVPLLVITPSVPASMIGPDYFLDDKAISGLARYAAFWPGELRVIFRSGEPTDIAFGRILDPADLPFELAIVPGNTAIPTELFSDASIVLASGDNHNDFPLAPSCRALAVPLIFVVEHIVETRLKMVALGNQPPVSRLKSAVWTLMAELRRRRAFAAASGLQANGTPAGRAYASLTSDMLVFFDTRMTRKMMATDDEIARKAAYLSSGRPLRLGFSGRLEPLKGASHLVDVAERLRALNTPFSLDIFGKGTLEPVIRQRIEATGLQDCVSLHAPLDFETELVPRFKDSIDLFVCCHRQADPSCTYLETFGCGVPIIAYRNKAFDGLLALTDAGWTTPAGNPAKMAAAIAALDKDRAAIIGAVKKARALAFDNDFDTTFKKRTDQLIRIWQARA